MSSLQITFIVLGAIVILAVFAYNLWYNDRHAPRKAREIFSSQDETPAPEATRREPALDGSAAPRFGGDGPREPALDLPAHTQPHTAPQSAHAAQPQTQATQQPAQVASEPPKPTGLFGKGRRPKPQDAAQVEAPQAAAPEAATSQATPQTEAMDVVPNDFAQQAPHAQESADSVAAPAAPAAAAELPSQEFDSLVFSIIELAVDKPVAGEVAMAALPPTHRIGKKQFLVQGMNTQTRQWEPPRAGSRYGAFEAAIQLANRHGALNELEFSEFVAKTQEFADAIGAAPDFPDMLHEVARGREVDAFAAANDAVLNLMLVAQRATWSPGYVNQCAARHGFKPSVTPGRLVLPSVHPHSPPVLVLSYDPQAAMADDLDHTPISEILLTLDVPNVDRAENAFGRLRTILDEMAHTMEGQITDPNGRKQPAMALDSIGQDLERLYEALESRGFAAGSPAALKLFS